MLKQGFFPLNYSSDIKANKKILYDKKYVKMLNVNLRELQT